MWKWTALTFALILSSHTVIWSQEPADELVLTGTVLNVSSNVDTRSGEDVFSFQVVLYLQLRNKTDKTLIVFRPDRFMGQKKLEFLENDYSNGFKKGAAQTLPWIRPASRDDYDPFPQYVRSIDLAPEPLKDGFAIIEPGSYFEFRDVVTVDIGYLPDVTKLERMKKIYHQYDQKRFGLGQPRSEFPALQIEYYLSFKKHHEDEEFLRNIKKRWKAFGTLFLNGNGDFLLKSQPINNQTGPLK